MVFDNPVRVLKLRLAEQAAARAAGLPADSPT
jgi:hypothetical protein